MQPVNVDSSYNLFLLVVVALKPQDFKLEGI